MSASRRAVFATLLAAIALSGCSGSSDGNQSGAAPPGFIDARQVDIAGSWEGMASILTADSGAQTSIGRYEISEPVDGVFTVHETLKLAKPSELQEGKPLTTTAEQDLLGVIAPDGSIRMVKITDDVQFQGWFTDADTLHMVLWEAGEHAVVGTRSATRVAD